jgi:benzoyl-CoA reductase/2-hydroxyglutaryl-CoA dehydratase subunit BcrC/BadD/HgdB
MMRDATISARKMLGQKTVVVLPVHYPRELFTAMDVHTVELWGPPGPPRGPDAGRIQTYACAVVRNALAFLAAGGADAADAVLFPHTCDSIQGLATLAPDFGGWGKRTLRFLHPKGGDSPAARAFVRAELSLLSDRLAELTGRPLALPRLAEAIRLHARIDRLRGDLLSRRAFLDRTDPELYLLLRRGEFLWPEDHLAELSDAARGLGGERVQRGVPLMVTGYVPEPMTLFDALASAGAFVAADDYAAVGRRVPLSPMADGGNPLDTLAAKAFAMPPCPTRGGDQEVRMEYLEALYRRSGAAGLVVHVQKFCEPELFDVPAIRRRFARIDAPLLYLEGELESSLSGQVVTRLEAFVEMVNARRKAP